MNKKRRAKQQQKLRTRQIVIVALIVGALIIGGLVVAQQFASGGGTTLRDTDTAFSIPTHVGQPAPTFTAINVDGQLYTVTPGDGRPKAIVFYMGFQ
jgi:cytochrome oxidase Cu insertion factor (SCO1/SenC/PrrC family)